MSDLAERLEKIAWPGDLFAQAAAYIRKLEADSRYQMYLEIKGRIEREIAAKEAATIERCAKVADATSHDDIVTAGQGRVIDACLEIGHRIRAIAKSTKDS